MSVISLGGLELDVWEGGDGPPLIFLHGAEGFSASDEFVGRLGRQRRVIAPAHPGFGLSPLPDWIDRPDDIAHVYLSLLDRLGRAPVDVIGCSLGGWIAAELACMVPERIRRLVLAGPVGVKLGSRERLDVPDIFAMSTAAVEKLLYHDPDRQRPDMTKLTDAQLAVMLRNRETTALLTWEPFMHNPKLRHRLHRVQVPALFLRGEADGLVSAAYLEGYAALLPDVRTITIPAAGHLPQQEQPAAFADVVLSFLNP